MCSRELVGEARRFSKGTLIQGILAEMINEGRMTP